MRDALAQPDRSDVEERVRRLLAQLPGRPAAEKQILVRRRGPGVLSPGARHRASLRGR